MVFVLWMTGLPCSGKTSIGKKLQEVIPNLALLDGDELREWLSPKDFSKEGRDEHNKKVAHLAKLLLKHDVPVVVSLVSPYILNRENARKVIGVWARSLFSSDEEIKIVCSAAENEKYYDECITKIHKIKCSGVFILPDNTTIDITDKIGCGLQR